MLLLFGVLGAIEPLSSDLSYSFIGVISFSFLGDTLGDGRLGWTELFR
jgi:hypothetical protein